MSSKKLSAIFFSCLVIMLVTLSAYQDKVSAYNCGYICGDCNQMQSEASARDCNFGRVTYYSSPSSCYASCPY
jgi:hypothetical protein